MINLKRNISSATSRAIVFIVSVLAVCGLATGAAFADTMELTYKAQHSDWPAPQGVETVHTETVEMYDYVDLWYPISQLDEEEADMWDLDGPYTLYVRDGQVDLSGASHFYADPTTPTIYYSWLQKPAQESTYATSSDEGQQGVLRYRIFGDASAPDFSSTGGYDYSKVMSDYVEVPWTIGSDLPEFLTNDFIYDEAGIPFYIRVMINSDGGNNTKGTTKSGTKVAADPEVFAYTELTVNVYVFPYQPLSNYTECPNIGSQGDITYVDLSVLFDLPRPADAGVAMTRSSRIVGEDVTVAANKVSSDSHWAFKGWWVCVGDKGGGSSRGATKGVPDDYYPSLYVSSQQYVPGSKIVSDPYEQFSPVGEEHLVLTGYWVYCPDEIVLHKTDTDGNPLAGAIFYISAEGYRYGEGYIPKPNITSNAVISQEEPYGAFGKTDENGDLYIRYDQDVFKELWVIERWAPTGYDYEKFTEGEYAGQYVSYYYVSLADPSVPRFARYAYAGGGGIYVKGANTKGEDPGAASGYIKVTDEEIANGVFTIVDPDYGINLLKTDINGDPIEGATFKVEYVSSNYHNSDCWNNWDEENWTFGQYFDGSGDIIVNKSAKNTKDVPAAQTDIPGPNHVYEATTGADGIALLRLNIEIDADTEHLSYAIYKITETSVPENVDKEDNAWYLFVTYDYDDNDNLVMRHSIIEPGKPTSHTANFSDDGTRNEYLNLTDDAEQMQAAYSLNATYSSGQVTGYYDYDGLIVAGAASFDVEVSYDGDSFAVYPDSYSDALLYDREAGPRGEDYDGDVTPVTVHVDGSTAMFDWYASLGNTKNRQSNSYYGYYAKVTQLYDENGDVIDLDAITPKYPIVEAPADSGADFMVQNDVRANVTYQWASDTPLPPDAASILPAEIEGYVGDDLTSALEAEPVSSDGSYVFTGWTCDVNALANLPREGVVLYGTWRHVSELSVVLHNTEGEILPNGNFTVTAQAKKMRGSVSYQTTSAADGSLDMTQALAAVLDGANTITITEDEAPETYIKAEGTWTITVSDDLSSYAISYDAGEGDNPSMSYIEGATTGNAFILVNERALATLSYAWADGSPVPADAVLPQSVTGVVGEDMTQKLAGDPTTTDTSYRFWGWDYDGEKLASLPADGLVVYGYWSHANELSVILHNTERQILPNGNFTVTAETGGSTRSANISYQTTSAADGSLDMEPAVQALLDGANKITIVEDSAPTNYLKANGTWAIYPGTDMSTYTIEYYGADGDNPDMEYIEAPDTGTTLILVNERAKATLSYQWSGAAPADAVLPASQTDYVGTDMTSQIAAAPTTADAHWSFAGWEYDAAKVASLPADGVVVTGKWNYAAGLAVTLKSTDGAPIANSAFAIAASGNTTSAAGLYSATTAADGSLDMSGALPYLLAGATKITITQDSATSPYVKAAGTWTITPAQNGYAISYAKGSGDTLTSYIEGATSGTAFTILNDTQKATLSYKWASGSPVPADAVLPASQTGYVGENMTSKLAGAPTTADGTYLFLGWDYDADKVSSLPAEGAVVTGSWKHVDELTVVLHDTKGTPLANGKFTITANGGTRAAGYSTTTDDAGALDMTEARSRLLAGATSLTITEEAAPNTYIKANGVWTISASDNLSNYTIAYAASETDNPEMEYIEGATSGKAFVLVNERGTAKMSYQWSEFSPDDVTLPDSVDAVIGSDMTAALAPAPETADPHYKFLGWQYDADKLADFPAEGVAITGLWTYAPPLEIFLTSADGKPLAGASFLITADGQPIGGADGIVITDKDGELDTSAIIEAFLNGAEEVTITEVEPAEGYLKGHGTWSIVPSTAGDGYHISYATADGDVETFTYIAGETDGAKFNLVNNKAEEPAPEPAPAPDNSGVAAEKIQPAPQKLQSTSDIAPIAALIAAALAASSACAIAVRRRGSRD